MKIDIRYFLILGIIMACSSKKGDHQAAALQRAEEWPEMESFHMVMAEAYHPFKDSANFEPIKSLAENLAKESAAWAGAALPNGMDNTEVNAKLKKLKTDCRALADQIKGGATNEQIGTSLTSIHDQFHGIMETWQEGREK
jgi:hypothetical protein